MHFALTLWQFLGHDIWHWKSGNGYQFHSGIAGELTILGGVVALLRRHNCHTRRCWRLGKHTVEGTPYVVCGRHHPEVPNRGAELQHIHRAHAAHKLHHEN